MAGITDLLKSHLAKIDDQIAILTRERDLAREALKPFLSTLRGRSDIEGHVVLHVTSSALGLASAALCGNPDSRFVDLDTAYKRLADTGLSAASITVWHTVGGACAARAGIGSAKFGDSFDEAIDAAITSHVQELQKRDAQS